MAASVFATRGYDHGDVHGREQLKKLVTETFRDPKCADFRVVVEDMIAEGDRVAIRQTISYGGTTRRQATFYRMADGRIVEDSPITGPEQTK